MKASPGSRQRGGAFGTLVVLVALAVIGYYVYQQYLSPRGEETRYCQKEFYACQAECRKAAGEADEYRACERHCNEQLAACRNP